jgi:hypothetical protein
MRTAFFSVLVWMVAACGGGAPPRAEPATGAQLQPGEPAASGQPAGLALTSGPGDAQSGMGGGSCGLAQPAFCEPFDRPHASRGRMGELDPARWSAGRVQPNLPSGAGRAMPIGAATLPACRSGRTAKGFPDQATLICPKAAGIASSHLLVAAQNYGQNSYRIRQPFDFAGDYPPVVANVTLIVATE